MNETELTLKIRQQPLPPAHDPYQWTGWPLFERYGLTGDGHPVRKMGGTGWQLRRRKEKAKAAAYDVGTEQYCCGTTLGRSSEDGHCLGCG